MKVLLIGANGQLGHALYHTRPDDVKILLCDYPKIDFVSDSSIRNCVERYNVDWVINAAAYTAVDKAENEPELANRINRDAVETLSLICKKKSVRLVHISTDFVFSGANFKPWLPKDNPDPVSIYGSSKLEGENAVKDILGNRALIIRTAWLYSSHGTNFVKTMLDLMTSNEKLNVVDDQIGTPTWATGLASTVWKLIKMKLGGMYHWTDAGIASWYDFAVAVQEEALNLGLLEKEIPILPISTDSFPRPAKRPHYSVLDKRKTWDKTKCEPMHWRKHLRMMLRELV
ncbi:MAG: dTDP-4-dehydrorhamnose reductase [Desulfobacterales bacterium]|nr:dTDP-4-dehydrorhamnose reductase [Desulfobacterales bacterium]